MTADLICDMMMHVLVVGNIAIVEDRWEVEVEGGYVIG